MTCRKKKKKRKLHHEGEEEGKRAASSGGEVQVKEEEEEDVKVETGTGRITSSGTIVTGHGTSFLNQLKVHDAIMITHPTT